MTGQDPDEVREWEAVIDQVIFHTEVERNENPLPNKASMIHGLNTAVRVNNKIANCLMGMCHLKLKLAPFLGDFFEPSPEKGIQLLERSKDKGYAPAIYQLAECYRFELTPPNLSCRYP